MPLTPLVFEPEFGAETPLPEDKLPDNWLDLFVNALLASGISDTSAELRGQFDIHIGPNSSFAFKNELSHLLQLIYKRFRVEGENKLTSNTKAAIAIKIQEGIMACSAGFYNRIITINQSFSTPYTLKALLTQIRHDLVNKAAIKAIERVESEGYHVHVQNTFFWVASQHFGVQKIQSNDPYHGPISDEKIYKQLKAIMKKEYRSPIRLISQLRDLLRSILEEQFYYTGRKNEGWTYADTEKWQEYLQKIGIP